MEKTVNQNATAANAGHRPIHPSLVHPWWPEDRLGASAGSVIDQNGDILSTIAPCLAAGLFPKPLLDFSFFSCRDLSRNVRCETGETASAAFRTGHFSHGCGLHHLDVHHARSCHILQLSGSSG